MDADADRAASRRGAGKCIFGQSGEEGKTVAGWVIPWVLYHFVQFVCHGSQGPFYTKNFRVSQVFSRRFESSKHVTKLAENGQKIKFPPRRRVWCSAPRRSHEMQFLRPMRTHLGLPEGVGDSATVHTTILIDSLAPRFTVNNIPKMLRQCC